MTAGFPMQYEAIYHGDDGPEPAGTLAMDADGKLTILEVKEGFANTLDIAVNNMNGMVTGSVRVPPPPGAPRYSLRSRVIPRDSPEFIASMLADLRRGYQLELQQVGRPS